MEHQELKNAGLKVTIPRVRILEILQQRQQTSEEQHLTAEDIYRELIDAGSEIGLATVYRVLSQFESAGLVRRHHFEGGQAVFELDTGGHHDHIVCMQCGKVEEFVDDVIEERQKRVAQSHDFALNDHSLILYGECLRCDHADDRRNTGCRSEDEEA